MRTPGPWTIRYSMARGASMLEDADGNKLAHIYHSRIGTPEALANAKLIAAAPELLEALEEAHEDCLDCEKALPCTARDALAKAGGEQ